MSKPLWHTISIQIPDKMINISKNGRMSIKSSSTKKGNISRSNDEPSIIIQIILSIFMIFRASTRFILYNLTSYGTDKLRCKKIE